MARKQANVTIDGNGRDAGKVFVLTELSAAAAETWAARAMFAMLNAGVAIPDNIAQAGLAGIAALGVNALSKLSFDAAKPLLDEMFDCVQIQPSPKVVRALVDDDIEDVSTRLVLRREIFKLHIDFFTDAGQ
jgi:hypothetical protein